MRLSFPLLWLWCVTALGGVFAPENPIFDGHKFTPRDVSGLVGWYDFSDPYAYRPLNGAGISKVIDKSGLGHDLLQGTAANQPLISRSDSKGNGATYSEDLTQTAWTATSATKNSANTLTFTAQNGKVVQNVNTTPGVSYVFSFYANTNSGNTALTICTTGSASGDTTAVTLDGTLKPYSVTVLGKATGGNVAFGIQDANAAGFGQIVFTQMQVRATTWDSDYVATGATIQVPGLNGKTTAYFDGTAHYLKTAAFTLNQPTTCIWVGKQVTWTQDDTILDGNNFNSGRLYQVTGGPPTLSLYAGGFGGSNTNLAVGAYGIVQILFSGASSLIKVNNTASATGNAGANNMGGFTLGSNGVGTQLANIQTSQVLIYNRVLDAWEIAAIKKWAQSIGGAALAF